MKSKTKSTRDHLTIDSKSRKISDQSKTQQKPSQVHQQSETRKYLLKTISILQQNIKIPKVQKKSQNSMLSASIYNIVKQHFANNSKSKPQEYNSMIMDKKQNNVNQINKSTASLINVNSIQIKRRSNSTLDQYFKEKFGSPAKDEETIEKRLKLLDAIKKSQKFINKGGKGQQKSKLNIHALEQRDKNNIWQFEKEVKKGK